MKPSVCACSVPLGYIIYYSTNVNAEDHDWVVEPVVGNRLTHQIQELTLDTTYYFKIQARNSKGMGPMSEAVHFRTPKSEWFTPNPNVCVSNRSPLNISLAVCVFLAICLVSTCPPVPPPLLTLPTCRSLSLCRSSFQLTCFLLFIVSPSLLSFGLLS